MIETLEYVEKAGWGWNVHLLRLPSGGLFVYSPTWLGPDTFARVEQHGTPEVLFAPNHFHHLALERYRDRWPRAVACASRGALPRLEKQGHRGLRDAAEAPLPDGMRLLVSEGTRSGETIASVQGQWIVCDAFVNFTRPITGLPGVAMRLIRIASGLSISEIFKRIVVKDRAAYKRWLFEQLARDQPKTVHFSHGAPLTGDDVAARLRAVVDRRLP